MTAANWGFEWGDAYWGEEQLDVRSRLLKFVRSPRLTAMVQAFADRTENHLDTASDVAAAFDLDTAVGVHLDRLGEILQLPRYGYDDDRYRTLLQIQVQLVLSSTTTTSTILEIVALFTGADPLSYADHYPMGFEVGAALADPTDSALLLEILNSAKAAAYEVTLIAASSDALILDYVADPLTLEAKDVGDYRAAPITGAGVTSYTFTT